MVEEYAGLITVVLCITPGQNQPLAARHLHAIANVSWMALVWKLTSERPELVDSPALPAGRSYEAFVVRGRGSQPFGHGYLWPLVHLPNKLVGLRLSNLRLSHAMILQGEKRNEKWFQATDLRATLSTDRQ
jgi:hypothetical protein